MIFTQPQSDFGMIIRFSQPQSFVMIMNEQFRMKMILKYEPTVLNHVGDTLFRRSGM